MYSTSLRSIRDWIWGFITILARQPSLAFQLYGHEHYHHTWYTCVCLRIGNPSFKDVAFFNGETNGFCGPHFNNLNESPKSSYMLITLHHASTSCVCPVHPNHCGFSHVTSHLHETKDIPRDPGCWIHGFI